MQKNLFQYTTLSIVICSVLYSNTSIAEEYFDPTLIEGGQSSAHVDLSLFDKAGNQPKGTYLSSIYLNQSYVDNQKIHYDYTDEKKLFPVLTKEQYVQFGVLANATPEFMNLPNDQVIKDIGKFIPDAFVKYNFEQSRLTISVPQKYSQRTIQGYVPESQWDDGITALFTNYNYSGATTKTDGQSSQNTSYLNLRSGFNWGAWRLRNYSTYSESKNTSKWQNVNTYLERDIKSLKGQLVIGDSYTPSDMFDSFSFRGIQLASDDAMQPSSLRGFAPIIRGIAQSNAQVTIRQNGTTIWQSYVSPGPFVIDDLYPTSSSGDLEVIVKEVDGSTHSFIQPFSSVPIMVREGRFKYSLTAGEYRSNTDGEKTPNFVQTTAIYGLPYTSTVYGGTIISKNYNSALLGVGKSLGDFGSVSFDATLANTKLYGINGTGGSFRFQYAKEVLSTGTSFSLAGYRYSTSKYRDFSEANGYYPNNYGDNSNSSIAEGYNAWRSTQNKRDRLQLNINQTLGDYGSLYLTGYQQQYWNAKGKERSVNFGYNKSYKGVTYSFNYAYSKDMYFNKKDQTFSLSVQVPLDFMRVNNTWLNLSTNSDDKGNNTSSAGVSGSLLADNTLQYNVQEGYTNRGVGSTGNASGTYKAGFGEYQMGYNYTRHSQQLNYGAAGAVVIHPYGVSFSQSLGETSALVRAKGADNVSVMNNIGVYTDKQGNAMVPYVSPYQQNTLSLDPASSGKNIDLINNTKTVVPTRGAIVLADYPTQIGHKIFVTLTGKNIPFGAQAIISNDGSTSSGIVDDGGKVYLSGAPSEGVIKVTWNNQQCQAPYKVVNKNADVISLSAVCN